MRYTICSVGLALSLGCSKMAFTDAPVVVGKKDVTCHTGHVELKIPTKVVFLVDMSGSNLHGPFEHGGHATDPHKSLRYSAINAFFQKYSAASNVSWSFVAFNDKAAHAFVSSGSDQRPIFSNSAAMADALQVFLNTDDVDGTPYKAALNMAKELIAQDLPTAASDTQYRIAMLTDGYPTDYCSNGPDEFNCMGHIMDDVLMNDVKSLVSAAPGVTQLSTVYYGLPDPKASARLKNMSVVGKGAFVDYNETGGIDLGNIIQVPIEVCK